MGMYDLIVCKYPLPGTPPEFCADSYHEYQSKSLQCLLDTYEIATTGELRRIAKWSRDDNPKEYEPVKFQGVLEFYDDNLSATAGGVSFTRNGEDYEWVVYEATFVNGLVQSIVETERERHPALARHLLDEIDARFREGEPEVTMTEPEIGQSLYLQWGGSAPGFPVTLLAKTQKGWNVADAQGRITKLCPRDLGRLLFHSQEESDTHKAWREKTQDLRRAYLKGLLKCSD